MNTNDVSANMPVSPNASNNERVRKYGPRTNALDAISEVDLTGRTILITGTTSGIGTETARALALKGAHVVMANRNILLAEALKKRILEEKPDAKIDLIMCDLSSLQSVQAAANEFKDHNWPLHALILSAGVFSPSQKTTIDGLETSFGVNHVAHQYLVRELLPLLRQSSARVVVVSSHSHNHTGLHRDENKNGISAYVLHPGTMIGTDISRSYGILGKIWNTVSKPFTKSLEQGAATTVYCAASPEVVDISGKYWESCWDDEKNLDVQLARDEQLQNALWERTDEILDKFEASRQPIKTVAET